MTTLAQLTEDIIAEYASEQALVRGRALYLNHAVQERLLFDNTTLEAVVQDGNRDCDLQVHFEGDNLMVACDCRESRRAVCAHTVALLLAWIIEPVSFERDNTPIVLGPPATAVVPPPAIVPPVTAVAPPPATAPSSATVDAEREVAQMLSLLSVPQLRDLAKRYSLAVSGTSRETFVKPLARLLAQRETVTRVWPGLSRPARKLLGALPLLRVNNLVYPQHAKQALQMLDSQAAAHIDALLSELNGFGFIFGTQQSMLSVPSQLGWHLPPDADFGPQPDDHARLKPQAAAPAPLEFVSLVTRLALVLKTNPDRFTARPRPGPLPVEQQVANLTGWPHYPAELEAFKYDSQALNQIFTKSFGVPPAPSPVIDEARDELARLVDAKLDRLNFALRLLIHLGIVKAVPGQPLSVVEQGFHDWLAQPLLERAVGLCTAFTHLNTWTELDRLSDLHHPAPHLRHLGNISYNQTYATTLAALAVARSYLLLMLRRVPPDRWVDLEAFVTRARAFHVNPNMWPLGQGAYLDLNGRQPNPATVNDWQAVYGAFLETILTGPLWWQGAVELAARLDRVVAFRLTNFGARLFGQNFDYVAPRSAETRRPAAPAFLPNGDLTLQLDATAPDLLGLLTQVCEAHSDPAGQLVYRLSPASVARLFEAGWDAAKLIDTLRTAIGQPLPDVWRTSLSAWWANFGTLHLYADVAVIELADDYALNELLAGATLAKHLLYRFSPRLIAVRAEGVDELRTELIKKGYTPKTVGSGE